MAEFKVGDRVRANGDPSTVLAVHGRWLWIEDERGPFTDEAQFYELVPPDPTAALIAAVYAWADVWHHGPTIGASGRLYDAVQAHREANQ